MTEGFVLVAIESPYAGDVDRNLRYLRAAMADCLARNEAPFASHALYTQPGVLDDTVPLERIKGIAAGFAWAAKAAKRVVYTDLGTSRGMLQGIEHAQLIGQPVEYRTLPGWCATKTHTLHRLCDECAGEITIVTDRAPTHEESTRSILCSRCTYAPGRHG